MSLDRHAVNTTNIQDKIKNKAQSNGKILPPFSDSIECWTSENIKECDILTDCGGGGRRFGRKDRLTVKGGQPRNTGDGGWEWGEGY